MHSSVSMMSGIAGIHLIRLCGPSGAIPRVTVGPLTWMVLLATEDDAHL